MRSLLALWLGGAFGLGLYLVAAGVRGHSVLPSRARRAHRNGSPKANARRLAVAAAVGVVAWMATGWLAAVPIGFLLVVGVPRLFVERERKVWIAKTEAIATWTEMLRDAMAAADGVEGAISATVAIAPAPIRRDVSVLAARSRSISLPGALAEFGQSLDHPSGDLVVAALTSAAEGQGSDFVAVLSRLAAITRDEVRMRLRVEAGRARIRTSSRLLLGLIVVAFLALAVLNRGYLEPYSTPTGQTVLIVVAGMFAFGALLMDRMSRIQLPDRFTPRRHQPRHTETGT
jgi:Flp pilus assembly protein TadB